MQAAEEHMLRDKDDVHLAGGVVQLRFHSTTGYVTVPIGESPLISGRPKIETEILLDLSARSVVVRGRELPVLPRKEFDILECLFQNKGAAVSRDRIAAAGWPERPNDVPDQDIDQYIRRLRRKIEETPSHPKLIVTRVGYGYMIP